MDCEVSPEAFRAMAMNDIDSISRLSENEVRPLLPNLVRIALCRSLDDSNYWNHQRKRILQILSNHEISNLIVTLLSVDFHSLEVEVKKEQQMRAKLSSVEESLLQSASENIAIDFERSDGLKRLRLVLSELFSAQTFIKFYLNQPKPSPFNQRTSELFDNEVYIDEICDAFAIAISELPNTICLIDVVETLLYFKKGHYIICRLVANFPEMFTEVCSSLLMNGDKQDDDSITGKRRIELIRMLCKMNPSQALLVRSEALESYRMPALCVLLTLDNIQSYETAPDDVRIRQINDLVSFVSGIFFGNDEKIRTWFVSYIRNCQKKMDQGTSCSLNPLRTELLSSLKFVLNKNEDNRGNLTSYLVEASAILRLYCTLRGIASMKFTDEETTVLLELVTQHPAASPAGIRFASVGLCLLLACPSIISNQESEKKTLEWLHWLVKEESLFGQVAGVRSSFGEMLLLIAIHFHGNQITAISELVSSTLGIKLTLRTSALTRLKTMFTQEVFTDQMITAHAVKVPVTTYLNSSIPGFLPVHCIYQLLKTRAFTKYRVPIKEWIYRQICNCTAPLNPVIPPLIEAYVNSVIIPFTKTSSITTNKPISEEEIMTIFKHKIYSVEEESEAKMDVDEEFNPTCLLTTQLILLYYVLLYEDVRLSLMKNIVFHNRSVEKYSPSMFSQLPIFHLMQKAKNEPQNYGVLFPRLLKLISTHYPHLCLVQDWFAAEERDATTKIRVRVPVSELRARIKRSFELVETIPDQLSKTLERTLSLPNNYLWPLGSTFVENLPLLLNDAITPDTLEKAKKVWWQLNCIFPDNLCVMTVNSLSIYRDEKKLSWNDIVLDPLYVLRCDERVFRCPEILEITLHVLQCFLIASRIYFAHHLLEKPSKSTDEEKDREELRVALITAQESSAIQLLLECCLPMNEQEKTGPHPKLDRIRKLVGVHLHQVFIADPNLAKLVHFQGYPSELLPFTVSSIPSMHICLEFIPELLSQPDLEKQIFAIQLCSYLVEQYPIVKSLCIAKLCFNVSSTLLTILESEKWQKFFIPVAPALIRMCKPFPPLKEDAMNLMLKLGQISLSRLASIQPDFICTQKPLQKSADLEEIDWEEAKSFLSSLPSVDPLCHTIKQAIRTLG